MLKRRTVLQGALAGALLSGCSSGADQQTTGLDPGNPFDVSGEAALEVVVGEEYGGYGAPAYRRKFPHSTASASTSKKLRDVLQPRFAAGTPPDVVFNAGDKALAVGRLVKENYLADLAPVLEALAWDNENTTVQDVLLPGMLDAGRYEGSLRAINYLATVYGLWYSSQLFQKYDWDVPRTWPELLALSNEMKKAKVAPFTYAGRHPYYAFEAILTLAAKTGGHDVVKRIDNLEDGAWRDPSVTQALAAFGELAKRGLIAKGSSQFDHLGSQNRLLTSKAGLLPCGNWLENEMKPVIPVGFGLTMIGLPPLDASPALPRGLHVAPTAPLLVPEKAKNQPGGLEYVRAMLSKGVAAQVTAKSNQLTVVRGAADGLEISTALRSARDLLTAAGDQVITWYFADWYPDLGKEAGDATGAFLAGRLQADDWSTQLQAAADKLKQDDAVPKYHRD
ncbi:N-acetylglucosamine/diacetylchitobiose ABC transporter substrate-binding protein [Kribbella catacumbae]|uniref:N-acetylglucosamine/diacetylchitobiose ABC transporter substrate-binding protein n=1 Tax=Kribbella catacumbae TaxID=460086 RepID=UPI00035FBA22|nr:N-acetylglucosamine/diacetylchitobiose ABC transporter substrate-binding protein [Kribbella catacumbae]